jgi:hypothetical protein
MSGNGRVLSELHRHLGVNMRFTSNVGLTHYSAGQMGPDFIRISYGSAARCSLPRSISGKGESNGVLANFRRGHTPSGIRPPSEAVTGSTLSTVTASPVCRAFLSECETVRSVQTQDWSLPFPDNRSSVSFNGGSGCSARQIGYQR